MSSHALEMLLRRAAAGVARVLGRDCWLIRRAKPTYHAALHSIVEGYGTALHSYQEWMHNRKGIPTLINGIEFRLDHRDVLRQDTNYEAEVTDFLRAHVKPGEVCIDVGANVGAYVLQFAHWSRPTGRVIAFEPNPEARKMLQRHIRLNELGKRVVVVPAAIGSTRGKAVLHASGSDPMSRLAVPNKEIAARVSPVRVPVLVLDQYCRANRLAPDWLLIDIEGFELSALAGARDLIRSRGNALGLIVEMHPKDWHIAGTTRADADALLAELKLYPVPLTGQADPLKENGIVYLAHPNDHRAI